MILAYILTVMLWASGRAEEVTLLQVGNGATSSRTCERQLANCEDTFHKCDRDLEVCRREPEPAALPFGAEREEMIELLQEMDALQRAIYVDTDLGEIEWPRLQAPALGGNVPQVDGKYPLLADYLRSKGVKDFLPDQVPAGPENDFISKGADTDYWERSLEAFNELVEQGGHLRITAHTMGSVDGNSDAWHAMLIMLVTLDGKTLHLSTGYGRNVEMREDATSKGYDTSTDEGWSFLEHNERWLRYKVGRGYGHTKAGGALGTVTRNFTDGRGVDNGILPDVCAMIDDNAIHWESDPAIVKNEDWPKVWKLLEEIAKSPELVYYAHPTGVAIKPPWPFWNVKWEWAQPLTHKYKYVTDNRMSSFAMCCFDFVNYFIQELSEQNLIRKDYIVPACGAKAEFTAQGWTLAMTSPVVCIQKHWEWGR